MKHITQSITAVLLFLSLLTVSQADTRPLPKPGQGKRPSVAAVMGRGVSYLLRDDFTTDRAAGAVNGTVAEPGPGTRVVIDSAGTNLRLVDGYAEFTQTGVLADPGLWSSSFTRAAGRMIYFSILLTTDQATSYFGADTNQLANLGNNYFKFYGSGRYIYHATSAGAEAIIGTYTFGQAGELILILRSSGACLFAKGLGTYTNWTLLWFSTLSSTATLYPEAASETASFKLYSCRVPSTLWLPTPLLSHGFGSALSPSDGLGHAETTGLGSGGSGVTMTGATWSVASGKAVNTPTLGSDVITDGTFDTACGVTWTCGDGWSSGGGAAVKIAGAVNSNITYEVPGVSASDWLRASFDISAISGTIFLRFGDNYGTIRTSTGSFIDTQRTTNGYLGIRGGNTSTATVDNYVVKKLTLSTLFTNCQLNKSDVYASVGVTIPSAGFQGGMVLNLDSASSPANFVIVYYNRNDGKVYAVVCVGGTYTNKLAVAATYSAGANLVSRKIGNSYYVWYNNTYIGSFDISTVTGYAAVVNNTLHGLFSTGMPSEVQLDNSVVYPSGSGGEYNFLNVFTNWGLGIPKYGVPDHYQDWEKRAA